MYNKENETKKNYAYYLWTMVVSIATVMVIFNAPSINEVKRYSTYPLHFTLIVLLIFVFYLKTGKIQVALFQEVAFYRICFLFGLINTSGIFLFYSKELPRSEGDFWEFLVSIVVYAYLFYKVILALAFYYGKYAGTTEQSFFFKHEWLCFSIIIFLCWLPWIIVYYPASIEWDTYYPIRQFLGFEPKDNHFPWFYTIIVGSAYKWGVSIGDKNVGIFIYIIVRNMVCAFVYGHIVCRIRSYGVNRTIVILSEIFYAVTPFFGAYAKCAFKNTFAMAMFSLMIVSLIDVVNDNRDGVTNLSGYIRLGVGALFLCLFLNNGIFVVAPVFAVLIISELKNNRKTSLILLVFLVIFGAYKGVIKSVGIAPTNTAEALAIPIQQLSRTVRDHHNEFSDEEIKMVQEYADIQFISDVYDPLISDPEKEVWVKEDGSLYDLFKVWGHFLTKYPLTYCEALIGHGYGYYSFVPREPDVAYGYSQDETEHAANFNAGMTYFGWVRDVRFPEDFTCEYIEAFEGFRRLLHKWAIQWDSIPVLCITDTMPLYTWGTIVLGYVCVKKRRFLELVPVFTIVMMILTCIASPVNGCFRYYSPVAAAFPAMAVLIKNVGLGSCTEKG